LASLERLADATQAELIQLSFGARDLSQIEAAIERVRAHDQAPSDARFWQDEAPALAWPLLLALAFWFRRGWVVGQVALLLMLGSGCSTGLERVWLTPDQQGRLAFERGDYGVAAARFEDPLWQGLSFYAAEQWDKAAGAFARLDSPEALFDLGNAYAQGGKLASALHAYERALQKLPTFRAARKNRDRVRELLQSLQEDTDVEGNKHAETDHGDDVARVDADDRVKKPADAPPPPETGARALDAESDVQAKLWLARMSTDPAEFLRRKLAVQAAREGSR
jgi:Ca-activated chloride channel family protein